MLDPALATQLKSYLENLTLPIELVATVGTDSKSQEIIDLLDEIAPMSALIVVRYDGSDTRTPSFSINRVGTDTSVAFAGVPMGHEFTSLVLALLQVGGHPSKASQEVLQQVAELDADLNFETYFSLSCQNCPDVVQAINLMSVLNPRISHVAIDGGVFPAEIEERSIMSVPTVFLNGEVFGQGRMTLEEIVDKVDDSSGARAAAQISSKDEFDVLVVGGGPAGSAAAVYAARKGIRTGLVAESFGGQLNDTLGIENLISVLHTEGPKLVGALERHVQEYDVDVVTNQRVSGLSQRSEARSGVEVRLESGATLTAKSVVLATGARWRHMNVPGEDTYRNRGVAYCPHCDGPLYRGKRVAVIGGGNSGVEAAIDLAGLVSEVTLLEFDSTLRADEVLQTKLRSLRNVTVITSALTTEVLGDGAKVTGLRYTDRDADTPNEVFLDGIFVQIGLLPNTEFLDGILSLSSRGEIEIDDRGQTSMPGVFAAGDCTTVPYKQIVISIGQGATAALSAFDHLIRTSVPVEAGI